LTLLICANDEIGAKKDKHRKAAYIRFMKTPSNSQSYRLSVT
jgi:hypothetical protein